jgi:hypothetical protein
MAQQLQNVYIAAPGFAGVNTQKAPTQLGAEFAAVADNAIIDSFGRIAARLGLLPNVADISLMGGNAVESMLHYQDGTLFSAANNLVFSGTTVLTDITPVGATIVTDYWTMISFNHKMFMFGVGNDPLVYDQDTGVMQKHVDHTDYAGVVPTGHAALAGFGRVWVAQDEVIFWSDTLSGVKWNGPGSGSIDLHTVWPDGEDEVTAIAEHNNFLVIFAKNSILLYGGADDPSTMALVDTVSGIGCIHQRSLAATGSDLVFLDYTGLRSLGRTIQEKSVPIGDLSANVRDDIRTLNRLEVDPIQVQYVPDHSFILVCYPEQKIVYCFDQRTTLEDGSVRTTVWPDTEVHGVALDLLGNNLYLGNPKGINLYTGYQDDTASYPFRYHTNPMTFDNPANLKLLKKIVLRAEGGQGLNICIGWSYIRGGTFVSKCKTLAEGFISEYGIAEFAETISEFSSGILSSLLKFNATGSGTEVTVSIEADIDGESLAIQTLNFQALLGRMI